MPVFKPVLKFFGVFCITYIALYLFLSLQPVNDAHRSFFMGIAEPILKTTLPKTHITLKEGIRKEYAADNQINILFNNKEELEKEIARIRQENTSGKPVQAKIDSTETTFLFLETVLIPLIFLLSLVIATPSGIKEKLKSIFLGLIALYVFMFFKIWIYTLHMISTSHIGVYEFQPPLSSVVTFFGSNLKIGASMVFVALIWILASLRKKNWQELIADLASQNK